MARVLRGRVARSGVGLSAAFFWPVMLPAQHGELGRYLLAWLLGSGIAMLVSLVVLPHRRSERVSAAMEDWLRAAAAFTRALVAHPGLEERSADLTVAAKRLEAVSQSAIGSMGSVGLRQRGIGEMVSRAIWAQPVVAQLSTDGCEADAELAEVTATAFEGAAMLVGGGRAPESLPDLEHVRAVQLERLDGETPAAVAVAYPLRVVSLVASIEFWLAAATRGLRVRRPDVGDIAEEAPLAILRTTIRRKSVWLRAAVMSGLGAAGCVALVRGLGLEHGLWVLLAALISFQGTFSATTGRRHLVDSALGAAGGVGIAGALFALAPAHIVFVLLVPFAAFAAKYAQPTKMWMSQLVFTPFVLVNIVVLGAAPHISLGIERVENIALGAFVAAVLAFLVFPSGISQLLRDLSARALAATSAYASGEIERAEGGESPAADLRPAATRAVAEFEANLLAGHLAARSADPVLAQLDRRHAVARECLLAGDTCAFLAQRPQGATTARAIAEWWAATLDSLVPPPIVD